MSGYLLTLAADSDLDDIWRHVAEASGPAAADRVESDLHAKMQLLAASPHIGHVRSDLADESLRIHGVHNFLIVYRHEVTPIQIIRVLHGARDIESALGPG